MGQPNTCIRLSRGHYEPCSNLEYPTPPDSAARADTLVNLGSHFVAIYRSLTHTHARTTDETRTRETSETLLDVGITHSTIGTLFNNSKPWRGRGVPDDGLSFP